MTRPIFTPYWKGILLFLKDSKADWKPKLLVVLAIGYLLWPIDVLPDMIPILGWLDDFGAGTLAMWYLSRSAKRYLTEREHSSL